MILGCDWIKQHSPIDLDLRDNSSQPVIKKNGTQKLIFKDFTSPSSKPLIYAAKLEKLCRGETLGYVIQINAIHQTNSYQISNNAHPDIQAEL
jgi:hypothetical protein